ncbi:MAG TPA: hypothetical protein VFE17_02060 [Candidatus Baltobacteraceae bacterium]|nr:hypothetical protein [Candidatus Baltobacteraceae bacterium]
MALSHIVLHVALCNPALRAKPGTALPLHVVVTDKIHRDIIDQNYTIVRENGNEGTVEFDIPWGMYRAKLDMHAHGATCSAVDYFTVLADHPRTVSISLQQGPVNTVVPALVMGSAPIAFSYVQPTVVALDKSVTCNGPVGDPLSAPIVMENDADAYYATVFPSAILTQHGPPVVAVRLTDSHAGYHYIRVPAKFLQYAGMTPWPSSVSLNVNEDVIDYVADKPEDTLLCPHMYQVITQ